MRIISGGGFQIRLLPQTSLGIVEGRVCLGGFGFRVLVKVLLLGSSDLGSIWYGFGWWLCFRRFLRLDL